MAKTCLACSEDNPDICSFCTSCGEPLTDASQAEIRAVRTCSACKAEIPNPSALFCPGCGAPVTAKRTLPLSPKQIALVAGGIVAVIAVVVIGVLLVTGGGGDDEFANVFADFESAPLSDAALDAFALAIDDLPDPTGETEAEMVRSLLGQPDVFVLQFEEPEEGGPVQRFETWYYLELGVSYDFLDGALLTLFPIEGPDALTLIPLRFDPLDFSAETSLDDLRAMMIDPDSLVSEQPPEEYGTTIPVWSGEQLMAMFDDEGALFYVETIPLVPDE